MKRLQSIFWLACAVSLGWVMRGQHAQADGDTPTETTPQTDGPISRDTPQKRRAAEGLVWACEVFVGVSPTQPPAGPGDCVEPLHGRTKTGGGGEENGGAAVRGEPEQKRGEL